MSWLTWVWLASLRQFSKVTLGAVWLVTECHASLCTWWKVQVAEEPQGSFNWLVPGKCAKDFESVISEHMLWINKFISIYCGPALRWMPQDMPCSIHLSSVPQWMLQVISQSVKCVENYKNSLQAPIKPLSEAMLTNTHNAIWCNQSAMN